MRTREKRRASRRSPVGRRTVTSAQLDERSMHRRRLVRGTVIATVLMSSGSLVIFPLIPALQASLDISTATIGYLAAAGFGAALIAELLVAPFADRGQAKLMGVAGLVLMSASLAMSAIAPDALLLIAGRAVGGLGFGMFMAAASALLVRADPERSGEALGRLGAAELAGVAIGPLASGIGIAFASPSLILGISAVVVLAGIIPVALAFHEAPGDATMSRADATSNRLAAGARTATGSIRAETSAHELPSRTSLGLLRSRRVVGILLLYGAVTIPTGAYDAIWPRFMADIGAAEWLTALSYAFFAVPFAILAGWAGRFADRRGGVVGFMWGLAVLVPIISLYGFITNPWLATGVGFVESSGQALAFIGAAAAMAQTVPAARAGASQGLMRAFGLLTATGAAAVSGLAYQAGGAFWLFGGTAVAVVIVSAVGLVLVGGIGRRRRAASVGDVIGADIEVPTGDERATVADVDTTGEQVPAGNARSDSVRR